MVSPLRGRQTFMVEQINVLTHTKIHIWRRAVSTLGFVVVSQLIDCKESFVLLNWGRSFVSITDCYMWVALKPPNEFISRKTLL